MMDYTITRRRKKLRQRPKVRSKEDQEMLSSAKAVLMERNGFSEEEHTGISRSEAWITAPVLWKQHRYTKPYDVCVVCAL